MHMQLIESFEDGEFNGFYCTGCGKELVRRRKKGDESEPKSVSDDEVQRIRDHCEKCLETKHGKKSKRKP